MEFKTIFSSSIRNKYKNYICLKYISMNKKINKQNESNSKIFTIDKFSYYYI